MILRTSSPASRGPLSISTTTMSDHVQAWRTETHAVKTARGEPVYEDRPRYEMQPAVLSSDGHVIWVNDYPWEGAGENEAHAAAISEYMNKYCDEHGVFPIWGADSTQPSRGIRLRAGRHDPPPRRHRNRGPLPRLRGDEVGRGDSHHMPCPQRARCHRDPTFPEEREVGSTRVFDLNYCLGKAYLRQTVPAYVLVVPAERHQTVTLVGAGREMVTVRGGVGVIEAVDRHAFGLV